MIGKASISAFIDKVIAETKKDIVALQKWLQHVEYEIMEQHNPLTDEILYFIEYKRKWWFKKIYKIRNKVNQGVFGCDKDGLFGNYTNCLKIKQFISGETKIVKRPAIKPIPKDEGR